MRWIGLTFLGLVILGYFLSRPRFLRGVSLLKASEIIRHLMLNLGDTAFVVLRNSRQKSKRVVITKRKAFRDSESWKIEVASANLMDRSLDGGRTAFFERWLTSEGADVAKRDTNSPSIILSPPVPTDSKSDEFAKELAQAAFALISVDPEGKVQATWGGPADATAAINEAQEAIANPDFPKIGKVAARFAAKMYRIAKDLESK